MIQSLLRGGHAGFRRYLARGALGLLATAIVSGHVAGYYQIPFMEQIEHILYDARVRLSAPGGVDERIVIVAIDEPSLEIHGHWPWTREKLGLLLEQLLAHGVAVVGWDMVFPERDDIADLSVLRQLAAEKQDEHFLQRLDEFEPALDRDNRFAAVLASGPAILGYYFDTNRETAYETGALPAPAFELHESMMESIFLPRGEGFTSNLPVLMDATYGAGFINNPLVDEDGVVRRAPLLHEYKLAVYESLSLSVAATYFNDIALPVFVDSSRWMGDYPPLEGLELNGKPIPIDPQGGVMVPYRGGRGSFPYVSAAKVMAGDIDDPALLQGRIALIGATVPGLEDLRSTPFGSIYPGVEVHANVIAGILDNNFRWEPAYTAAAEMITVLAFGVLSALLLPILSPIVSTVITGVLGASALAVNYYMWEVQLHVLPLAMTLYTLFAIYTINMLFGYLFETRARSHMDSLFGQYVPPDLVKAMSRDPEHYSLESERRELSVLFTDIRGFTTISEGLDAGELSKLMDEYLTPMTRIVHETQGTIDKYMGDAIMAFWGAPLHHPHHADQAVSAGLAMLKELDVLNEGFRKKGWPDVHIGVGINTGMMNVGNMGSRFRRAYTVLGDAVNLGSRLEGITKVYGVGMIVSETTALSAGRYFYRELDRVRVKGKAKPVTILEPIGLEEEVTPEQRERVRQFEHFLFLFRSKSWDAAEEMLSLLKEQEPNSYLYHLYEQRIAHFRQEPPPPDWDGVVTFETK